ncbi:MAG: cysteine synthase family protein [Deltaproteobacteria bacterium]|nr:cysteine synthase family protein [Deltaproteobacteria bacterium]
MRRPGDCGVCEPMEAIGNTPLVELKNLSPKPGVRLFAKLEGCNPSGSIKDRVVAGLIADLERSGKLQPGGTVVEASSGNTAIALGMVARRKGYNAHVVIPRGVPESICDTLDLFGVRIHWCEPLAGMRGAITAAHELAAKLGGVALNQFESQTNIEVHRTTTGAEILHDLPGITSFVAGIGTGGTIAGVGRALKAHDPAIRVVGVEPKMGERLQGLTALEDHFEAPLFDLELLDRRLLVDAATSLENMRRIVRAEGIMGGVSAGAVLHAGLREAERVDEGQIVMMFSDSGWKYLPARPWDAANRRDESLDEVHWW